jgi:peptide/nickel transport system substrate-binding protein
MAALARSRGQADLGTAVLVAVALTACGCGEARPPRPQRARVGLGTAILSFDPHSTTELVAIVVNSNLYETLVRPDAELGLRPLLATRWLSHDDRTWTFDLVSGVRFQDGSPLTSEDVAFSLLRERDDPLSEWSGGLSAVETVETPSPHRVVVRTRVPDPALMVAVASAQIVARSAGGIASSTLKRQPVGSGPYRLVSHSPTGVIELQAWDGYWGEKPSVSQLSFSSIPDDRQRVAALLEGRLDLVTDVPPELAPSIAGAPGYQVLERSSLLEVYLGFDHAHARTLYASPARNPFRDRRVRQAVAAAIDRARLVQEVLGNAGDVADQLVAHGVFGWDPERRPPRPDLALARRLIREAGYPDGFSVVLDAPDTSFVGDVRVGPFVARSLAEIGIRVELRQQPKAELFRRWAERDTSFFVGAWSCTSGDEQEVLDFLLHTPDQARGLGHENVGGYGNPEVDRLAGQARETMGRTLRLRLLREAAAAALDDVAWVPLYLPHDRYGIWRGLQWSPRPDGLILGAQMRVVDAGAPRGR